MWIELYRDDHPGLVNFNHVRLIYPEVIDNEDSHAVLEFDDGDKYSVDNSYHDVKDLLPYIVS